MADLNEHQIQDVTAEILEHMMAPKNYGQMENPTCTGMGVDTKTGEFALIYLQLDDKDEINDIKYGCNACQDTVIAGSLFTEMIKGMSLTYAQDAARRLELKLLDAPERQRACSMMVIKAFDASLLHKASIEAGGIEDMCSLELNESCEGMENLEEQNES
ncbi:MAG: iron-sulfur cluster assembly scaffold protein [Arcobacteraceae bacterium]|jgi:nitrogen fixation NifU-like protein|nr:iron-sulfur cluster assembly scaffold protein [Arcobacteraceae bacterium]